MFCACVLQLQSPNHTRGFTSKKNLIYEANLREDPYLSEFGIKTSSNIGGGRR